MTNFQLPKRAARRTRHPITVWYNSQTLSAAMQTATGIGIEP